MADSSAEGDFYSQKRNFNSKAFLEGGYNEDLTNKGLPMIADFMRIVCEIFKKYIPTSPGTSMLEFGCGPSIAMGLCASGKAANISYADYTRDNQEEILKWINKDPDAHNWSAYCQFVGEIQNIPSEEVEKRTRSAIKEVLSCDILAEDPTEPSKFAPFDIILSSLCLHFACPNAQNFNTAVQKLSSKLKPGGHFIICGLFGEDFYKLGGTKYSTLSQTQTDVDTGLRKAELKPLKWWIYDYMGMGESNATHYYIVCAKK